MFAVLKTGGKQYRVATGDVLRVEKLACEAGERIQFNDVLMIGGDDVTVGTPMIAGAAVQADVIDQIRGEKLIHFVKRRRKHGSQRTKGHRQYLTLLRVTDILATGADASGVKAAIGAGSTPAQRPAAPSQAAPASEASAAKPARKAKAKPAEPASETEEAGSGLSTLAIAAGAALAAGAAIAVGIAATRGSDDDAAGTEPGNLLAEARGGKPDDLKRLAGVGPKLVGVLHANGVFHFDQIAAWTPEEAAFMDDRLSAKGRIARDGWIEQATTFAAEQE